MGKNQLLQSSSLAITAIILVIAPSISIYFKAIASALS